MQTKSEQEHEPKKLQKPVRDEAEMQKEELVTYANEVQGTAEATTTI